MIEALGHRLTVRPDKPIDSEAEKTKKLAEKAGFVLPDKVAEDLDNEHLRVQASVDQGYVLTIGKTAFRDFGGDAWCDVGDYVAYARHAGKWVKDPDTDENILVINDEDVICRITKKDVAKDD
jgi:co-chaperonin GroES (HSP10)